MMEIKLQMEKVTKNTVRFEEILENELDAPKIGSIYIPKTTLNELHWIEGAVVTLKISALVEE